MEAVQKKAARWAGLAVLFNKELKKRSFDFYSTHIFEFSRSQLGDVILFGAFVTRY